LEEDDDFEEFEINNEEALGDVEMNGGYIDKQLW